MSRANIVVTSKGLQIGSAYTSPPPQPSADEEAIQSALLRLRRRDNHVIGYGGAMDPKRRAPSRPSVIPLDNSPAARFIRWVRAFFLNRRSPL